MAIDSIKVNSSNHPIIGMSGDRYYAGVDLTQKFAGEIGSTNVWTWIKQRIAAAATTGFNGLHVNDYIPFTTTNSVALKAAIAGLDTYYTYGDTPVGHHIDFICREIWPTVIKPANPVNYNNGLQALTSPAQAERPHPWLASDLYHFLNSLAGNVPNATTVNPATKAVNYATTGVYDKLPSALKSVIVEKRFVLETRYSASGLLTTSNSWGWMNIGKLWCPTEVEVFGAPVWGGAGFPSGGSVQYPVFANNMNRVKNLAGGGRAFWWLLTPHSGSSTNWCYVNIFGAANYIAASNTNVGAPVCFRIS